MKKRGVAEFENGMTVSAEEDGAWLERKGTIVPKSFYDEESVSLAVKEGANEIAAFNGAVMSAADKFYLRMFESGKVDRLRAMADQLRRKENRNEREEELLAETTSTLKLCEGLIEARKKMREEISIRTSPLMRTTIGTTKVGKLIPKVDFANVPAGSMVETTVSSEKAKDKQTVYFVVRSIEEPNDETKDKRISHFDLSVMRAAYDLYVRFNVFSLDQITRMVYGYTARQKVTETQSRKVRVSLEKLSATTFSIDFRKQGKRNPEDARWIKSEPFVSLIRLDREYKVNGHVVKEAYAIASEPPLYSYSKSVNQIASVPFDVLDIIHIDASSVGPFANSPKAMNEELVTIRDYVIQRIVRIRNMGANANNRISFLRYDTKKRFFSGALSVLGYELDGNEVVESAIVDGKPERKEVERRKLQKSKAWVAYVLYALKAKKFIRDFGVYYDDGSVAMADEKNKNCSGKNVLTKKAAGVVVTL